MVLPTLTSARATAGGCIRQWVVPRVVQPRLDNASPLPVCASEKWGSIVSEPASVTGVAEGKSTPRRKGAKAQRRQGRDGNELLAPFAPLRLGVLASWRSILSPEGARPPAGVHTRGHRSVSHRSDLLVISSQSSVNGEFSRVKRCNALRPRRSTLPQTSRFR